MLQQFFHLLSSLTILAAHRLVLDLFEELRRHLADVVNELAADAIRAVAVGRKLLAELGLIVLGHIGLNHKVRFVVGERALVSVFALAVHHPVLAHLCTELVDVWRRGREVLLQSDLAEVVELRPLLLGVSFAVAVIGF